MHPRLRRMRRKIPMVILGIVLLAIWVTLACTKLQALIFVDVVMVVGLTARQLNKWLATRKGPAPSLLRQAIMEQLTAQAMVQPKLLLGTYGSDMLASAAVRVAKEKGSTLVVCFIRQISLSYKYDQTRLNIDTDIAALRTFSRFLDLGHQNGVPILPVYDSGPEAAELMAETAAIYGVNEVLIGTSRRGVLYHLIKGHFQEKLEAILPEDVPVHVIAPNWTAMRRQSFIHQRAGPKWINGSNAKTNGVAGRLAVPIPRPLPAEMMRDRIEMPHVFA